MSSDSLLSCEYLLNAELHLPTHRKASDGAGSHMPEQDGQGQNPDFLMPGQVFLPENLATVLYRVIVNPGATTREPRSQAREMG